MLLFDEALSALDRKLREEMQVELRRLLQDVRATAIFVTHDQDEALTMSDRVAVMNKGRIEQLAEPRELYSRPASLFALNFVGLSTRIAGTVLVDSIGRQGRCRHQASAGCRRIGSFQSRARRSSSRRGPSNCVSVRNGEANAVSGRVRSVVFQGSRTLVEVDAGAGESLLAELSGRDARDAARRTTRSAWLAGRRDLCVSGGGAGMTEVALARLPCAAPAVDRERLTAFGFALPSFRDHRRRVRAAAGAAARRQRRSAPTG